MVDPPREVRLHPLAMRKWDAASEEEQLRSVTSVAQLVAADKADPTTPDHYDIEFSEPDEEEVPSHLHPLARGVGTPIVVTRMRQAASLLRSWGWTVLEADGWENRGVRSLNPTRIGCHHTAAETDIDRILRDGRADLPGPLCNFALHLDGVVVLMASGTANHFGVATVDNDEAYGIEATGPVPITAKGTSAFPNYLAYRALCVAIRVVHDWPVDHILGHKEVALPDGRKPDPAFGSVFPKPYPDMNRFRTDCNFSVILNPTMQDPEGFMAALTESQQQDMYRWLSAIGLRIPVDMPQVLDTMTKRALYTQVLVQQLANATGVSLPYTGAMAINGRTDPPGSAYVLDDDPQAIVSLAEADAAKLVTAITAAVQQETPPTV